MTRKNLKKTFNKFACHYSENLIKYDIPIQKLWQVCLNYNSVTPLRLPISLTNLGNTCYLNSVLQILFQVNTVVVGCLSVPSVIFWTKVPNLQGLLGRVC